VTALGKLFRTTTFKLTLVYLTVFALFAACLLGYFAWNTRRLITEQITTTVNAEIAEINDIYSRRGLRGLAFTIGNRALRPGANLYLVTTPAGTAFGGNVATTELLLKKGAAIDARAGSQFRNTPLQTALLSNQYATAKVLLEHGADALVRQSKGFTPMHEGALSGRIDIIQLLLDHGAEINSVADNGQTPLAEAMRGKHEEVVAWMKTKGAVVGIQPFDEDGKK